MVFKVFIVLSAYIFLVKAKGFENPTGTFEINNVNVVKYHDEYFAVSSSYSTCYSSSIWLQGPRQYVHDWRLIGDVFFSIGYPTWSRQQQYQFSSPEIYVIDDTNFGLYFDAAYKNDSRVIGSAIAMEIRGPYHPLDKPLLVGNGHSIDPSLFTDIDGYRHLLWADSNEGVIYSTPLTKDGLTADEESTTLILKPTLDWEGELVRSPFMILRNNTNYIIYSGKDNCGDGSNYIGVARSLYFNGPYEKMATPLLVTNDWYSDPCYPSVVKDDSGLNDLLTFNAYMNTGTCEKNALLLCIASMEWDEEGWPYIIDFGPESKVFP